MEHKWLVHKDCHRTFCEICLGGLSVCTVCGLIEGCLTSECPGEPSWEEHNEAVYHGEKDFRDGRWQEGVVSPHSPAYFKQGGKTCTG